MSLEMHSSGVFVGSPHDAAERRTIGQRARGWCGAGVIALASGVGAMLWTGHHALGQSRVTLRAAVQDTDHPISARRAALAALMRECSQDLERLRELAAEDSSQLGSDARVYIRKVHDLTE
jgi:hypothetical protein